MPITFPSRCLVVTLLVAPGCHASWKAQDVIVTPADGMPCFSVGSRDSAGNVHLYSIDIREENSATAGAWAVRINFPLNATKRSQTLRALPGEICPQSGTWVVAHTPSSARRFNKGEVMPELNLPNGETIWTLSAD